MKGLVGDDADDVTVQAGEPDDDVFRPEGLNLEKAAVVDDEVDDVDDVVRLPRIVGNEVAPTAGQSQEPLHLGRVPGDHKAGFLLGAAVPDVIR